MPIQSLRQFVSALDESKEIVHVKQAVDWDCEAGAIARRLAERRGPAVLFEKIKGYPTGSRFLCGFK